MNVKVKYNFRPNAVSRADPHLALSRAKPNQSEKVPEVQPSPSNPTHYQRLTQYGEARYRGVSAQASEDRRCGLN